MQEQLRITPTTKRESRTRRALKIYKAKGIILSGNEPKLDINVVDNPEQVKNKMIKAFNWYSSNCDSKKSKSWVIEYIKNYKKDKKLARLVGAANGYYPNTAGWIARLLNNGSVNIPEHYTKFLDETIEKMKQDGSGHLNDYDNKLKKLHEGRLNAQKRAKEKEEKRAQELTNTYICELEYQIDCFLESGCKSKFDVKNYLNQNKVTQSQAVDISSWFQKYETELTSVLDQDDEQLVEAYSFLNKKRLNSFLNFVQSIIEVSSEYSKDAPTTTEKIKKPRKPRKKKVKTPIEQIKKLFYLKECKEYKLKSISPEKIVGANQLWVFNTKYRYLGVYHSTDISGFSIKGSTIQGFDDETSIEKKLRKPEEILPEVLNSGKVALRKTMTKIRCKEKKLTGRINKHTILLRVL